MARLGIAASQLKSIDTETRKGLLRFFILALQSGDANTYIRESLAHLDEWREQQRERQTPAEPAPAYKASSRPIGERR